MRLTPFVLAQRMVGVAELAGEKSHPAIQWGLMLCGYDAETVDETPWCSAFLNLCCYLSRWPRSKSAAARSWLTLGVAVPLAEARENDVVVLKQRPGDPGPERTDFRGHVGLFAGTDGEFVEVLGGNQGDRVSVARFPVTRILSIRRLQEPA